MTVAFQDKSTFRKDKAWAPVFFVSLTRIGQFAYEIGLRTANLDHAPARDNRGPRVGRGSAGKLVL